MVTRVARAIDSLSHMCIYHLTSVMVLCAWRCVGASKGLTSHVQASMLAEDAGLPGLIQL